MRKSVYDKSDFDIDKVKIEEREKMKSEDDKIKNEL